MRLLTLDLGTSAVKAAVWGAGERVALAHAPVPTTHRRPGWAEQDPARWWQAICAATAQLEAARTGVIAVGFSSQRETFTLLDARLRPLGAALLWSDRRAGAEAVAVADAAGGLEAVWERTGVVLDAGSVPAKLAWLARNAPEQLAAATAAVGPRDLAVLHATGRLVTDVTLASRTGLVDRAGNPDAAVLAAVAADGLAAPDVLQPSDVAGLLRQQAADELGLDAGVPVVVGAGDRACEVVGTGAAPDAPMVSWGTTANVSVPLAAGGRAPRGSAVSAAATAGELAECGLSAAGVALGWLGRLTGRAPQELTSLAAAVPAGARGVDALAWLGGARAPWWEPRAGGTFLGLADGHGPGELARALYEGVALDVARCVELLCDRPQHLLAAGGGAHDVVWRAVLPAVTGLPLVHRRGGEAASVGAAVLTAAGIGMELDLDAVAPVCSSDHPDPQLCDVYRKLRGRSDAAAAAVLGLSR